MGEAVPIVHRSETGRSYRGIPMHAAGGVHEHVLDELRRAGTPAGRVLDVGAGSGALSARLLDAGYEVVAVDLDIGDFGVNVPVVQWDASAISLPASLRPESFDAVCAIEILEHVENPLQALRNFRALLRPGGSLVVSTPHVGHIRSRLKFLLRGSPSYFGPTEYHATGHRSIIPDWMLKIHLHDAGFASVSVDYAGQLGLKGRQAAAYWLLRPALDLLHLLPRDRIDDGAVTFAIGRKPGGGSTA